MMMMMMMMMTVFGADIAVNNIKVFSVATELQQFVYFVRF
jgi:hypothetical protein